MATEPKTTHKPDKDRDNDGSQNDKPAKTSDQPNVKPAQQDNR